MSTIKVKTIQLEDVKGFRFSIFRLNRNLQTVYLYHLGNTLIDTAQSKSRDTVLEHISDLPVEQILLTHFHEDHTGNAAFLSRHFNAPVYAHPICAKMISDGLKIPPLGALISGGVEKVQVHDLHDTEPVDAGKYKLQPIHTPGHTPDHYSYYVAEKGWLFSGDLYVADKIKYFSEEESMKQQIQSLEKLCALDFEVLFCSHNPKLKDGKARLLKKLQDFKDFYGNVIDLYQQGYDFNAILRKTGRKENTFYNVVTLGSFNAINMVKSVLRDEGLHSNL